jgi:tetratricopeptide (TPR) repeat protein
MSTLTNTPATEGGRRSPQTEPVRAWEQKVIIPTYPTPAPDLNPMFLEKRVYQGSSGRTYPSPFTDRVSNEKLDKAYQAVFLENEYIKLMILPEIGGRIHIAQDKTNNYDFIYRQTVIKPALVGLLGPWISGGVEFNWPQHHRPSTFMPVDHCIEEQADGSRTVWLSEHEPMGRMKGMVGICLHPGKALIEAKAQLYNRTPFVQTFLWWANVGIRVHDQYEAFFPPDVHHVADHAKRAMSSFPIARGYYYGVDYTRGVDIRWYKNIPVPTSYMVTESKYDFFGGYDHGRQAGIVHVANRHISPGKKLWTWGNGEFGYAWDRELTDVDGPYIELMAGVYTDNQPDFSFLHPYETKSFSQYWYPITQIGIVKNANRRVAVNLEVESGRARMGICATQALFRATLILSAGNTALLEKCVNLAPGSPLIETAGLPAGIAETDLLLQIRTHDGLELIRYRPEAPVERPVPPPASEPPLPKDVATADELYVIGVHLEQYRHATRYPESYWQEALARDPGDARCNNALGLLLLRQGRFVEAERYFRETIKRLTLKNPNPYDGEPSYNLGMALRYQEQLEEAYAAFYRATWNYAWNSPSYYALAEIDCHRGDWSTALDHLHHSLLTNARHLKARNLKAAVLRRLGRLEEAERIASETVALDPLDFWSRNELILVALAQADGPRAALLTRELAGLMGGRVQTYLDIAFDYAGAGLTAEASQFLERLLSSGAPNDRPHPMVLYSLGYFARKRGDADKARQYYKLARGASPDYCFPSRLEEMQVLLDARVVNKNDPRSAYYLGNLFYEKRRYEEAIENWEIARELEPKFSIPWRNLGIAYYNLHRDTEKTRYCYQKAFEANPQDARLLYEIDQLSKRLAVPPRERLQLLEGHPELVGHRDDLTVELARLYNDTGQPKKALEVIGGRRFHPWEGGEGLVPGQYVTAHLLLGCECLEAGRAQEALDHFEAAQRYPLNLGEGKHLLTPENHIHYYCGLARENLGDLDGARNHFQQALAGPSSYSPMTYYSALALKKLGFQDASAAKLRELLDYAQRQMNVEVAIDYFATSLPNFLIFEDDLQKRNQIDCTFLTGLAHLGLEEVDQARQAFQEVLSLDINHLDAQEELRRLA